MKKVIAILLSFMLLFQLTGCGTENQKTETDTITIVLDWTPNTNHTGIFVAQANGYFEEAGLSVEIVQPPEDGAITLVASGKAQFGVSFQDYLAPAFIGDSPMPITAVAAIAQHNTSGIISRAGEGIDTPKGLEGKKYATWDLDIEKATIREVMKTDGGNFNLVECIPSTVTDEVSALQNKSVDAIWIFYGWAGVACKVAGLETDYFAFADIDPQAPVHCLVIPKLHIGSADDVNEKNVDYISAIFTAIPKIAAELGLENGYRIITNLGEDGAQTVKHLHFHILGGKKLSEKIV